MIAVFTVAEKKYVTASFLSVKVVHSSKFEQSVPVILICAYKYLICTQ